MGVALAAVSTGLQVVGGITQAAGQQQAGQSQAAYNEYMAGEMDKQAVAIEQQGARDIGDFKKQVSRVDATQKAALAANGVYSDSGTAQDISGDTATQAKLDELTLKYKYDWEAYKAKSQAKGYRMTGANAVAAGNTAAAGTMIGTASQVANNWSRWSQTGA